MGLSIWQLLIIVLVVVLLFGANKIPRLARDMGSGINAFKRGLKETDPNNDEAQRIEGETTVAHGESADDRAAKT